MVKCIRAYLILLVFVFAASISGCQQQKSIQAFEAKTESPSQLSMEQKLEDFEYMYKVLEENYPFFEVNKRMNGIDWLANKDIYKNRINMAMTEQEYKDALDWILSDLNNDHTGIIGKPYYNFLRAATEPEKEKWMPWWEQLNKESAVKRNANVNEQGKTTSANDNNAKYITLNNIDAKLLRYKKVAYLGVKKLNKLNIESDMKIIKPFLESIKDYDALIIDIRQNGGGSSYYWSEHIVPMLINKPIKWTKYFVYRGGTFSEPFIKSLRGTGFESLKPIEEFAKEGLTKAPPEILKDYKYYINAEEIIQPKDSVNFRGKIYMLVDSEVYSSSEMWASFAKSTGFATLVGEKTGGDGIGQDPLICTLPNSGYVFRFPHVMGLTEDGSCNEEHKTEPDIKVPAKKTEDVSQDEAIQYVLKLYQ